jgi:hypothetical protein
MSLAELIVLALSQHESDNPRPDPSADQEALYAWRRDRVEVVQNIILEQLFGTPLEPRCKP